MMRGFLLLLTSLFSVVTTTVSFSTRISSQQQQRRRQNNANNNNDDDGRRRLSVGNEEENSSSSSDVCWKENNPRITVSSKISIREPLPDERGKGGVYCINEKIRALEVLARIPRNEIITTRDISAAALEAAANAKSLSWITDLTAVALAEVSSLDDNNTNNNKASWINSWIDGGWATNSADLGPEDTPWGPKCVTGSLLSTGSDNDKNIFAKFRMPCHPVLLRASAGLALLTGCSEDDARMALTNRGTQYRSMRDALLVLSDIPRWSGKGSLRERRTWDVADMMSKVLSRVTMLELNKQDDDDDDDETQLIMTKSYCIVPLHERLEYCGVKEEDNVKLVVVSNDDNNEDEEILLVATRDINVGEAITRDYTTAPKLDNDTSTGPLRLLLQFGVPVL